MIRFLRILRFTGLRYVDRRECFISGLGDYANVFLLFRRIVLARITAREISTVADTRWLVMSDSVARTV